MRGTTIPAGYKSKLSIFDTQIAIGMIKEIFPAALAENLNLRRVSAPIFVAPESGLNDDLNGVERPVRFDIPAAARDGVIVHSLAKWKRMALYRYDFRPGKGLYTDMNAIRRDETLSNIHSVYVDQWDWEKVILKENRTISYLKETVNGIVKAIGKTAALLRDKYPILSFVPEEEVFFITAQDLEDLYPDKTAKERETLITKEHKTVFIMQIGDCLRSGKPHDGRAPDYDDWSLNGDLLFWHDTLGIALELSSMGIRVDGETLNRQLMKAGAEERKNFPFHKLLLEDQLPLTIGGGIGQSRLSLLLLEKAHIGEVQASLWDADTIRICEDAGVCLL